MKKTNELFISLGWEVISAVLWTEGLLNSALDFLCIFFLSSLYPSPLSLSLPLHMNSEESTLHTGKLLIHGGTTGESFAVDWSWGVDSPVSDHELRGNLCCFSLFLGLICVLKQGFFVYWYNSPLLSPKMCVYLPIQTRLFCVLKVFG